MPSPAPPPRAGLQPGDRIASYRLERLIGRGAHGAVYLAEDVRSLTAVALKLVPLATDDEDPRWPRDAFRRSAEAAHRLAHPDIVALLDAGITGHMGWLAMEPVPGGDLSRYTHPLRLLPEALVLRVARRVTAALGHAHDQGVMHRDLKPANVLVHWPSDTVKLADFGLARTAETAQTGTGVVPGSPAYMAPEQLAGGVPTRRTDFYALGVMLFQLLTGRLPHEAASMGELLRRAASEPAPELCTLRPMLPPELGALVGGLLAKRPGDRPADAAAIAATLDAVAAKLAQPAPSH